MPRGGPTSPPAVPGSAAVGARDAAAGELIGQLDVVFQAYEVRILGIMGLLIGYICVFFAKIMSFSNIYAGLSGVALITFLLLCMNSAARFNEVRFWLRSILVVLICLIVTAPNMYFAWTVSVSEVQAQIRAHQAQQAANAKILDTTPSVNIINR